MKKFTIKTCIEKSITNKNVHKNALKMYEKCKNTTFKELLLLLALRMVSVLNE